MAHSLELKSQAITMRQNGYSIKEIAKALHIGVATSSLWLRDIKISPSGIDRMSQHQSLSRYKMSLRWQQKRQLQNEQYKSSANKLLKQIQRTKPTNKLLCSILFWTEGSKTNNHIAFTNSDPSMIKSFLRLLRTSYPLDESKFRVSVHLHEYHVPQEILSYWSELTAIPLTQFIKPYLKPHTGKRKRTNYQGCITVKYFDARIAHELTSIYNVFSEIN